MTFQEIAIEKYGGAQTLKVRDRQPTPPGPGEVAIDVAYSGVNFADVQMRLGFYPDAPKRPFVPGYEVSGRVAEVGPGVEGVTPGDLVAAGTYFGGYASRVTVPAGQVLRVPRGLDLRAGAAMPVAFFTAHVALFEMARIRKGDRVLIECATGGVGVLAMQLARHAGAEVTGLTTSPHKKAFIEGYGAIAYTRDEFRNDASLRGYDFILNASGGAEITWQRARLGITGRIVCIGVNSGVKDGRRNLPRMAWAALRTPRISVLKLFDENTGVYALNALHVLRDPAWIARLSTAFDALEDVPLTPHVGKVFPAVDVASAHACLETKQATGKVLLEW
ncbi:MAG: zinc-binding dehydrogenase [Kofleriaceae bacterium]|nr:zinc-binding dehydrogenase [Myxococcales bacterium]MCB9558966.1 zinc-binding dehydrogenase [Kofleriaceae bacterium]MCB9570474.1 zinc-binding dehydrogenase [Kofleriaceae bacterium]